MNTDFNLSLSNNVLLGRGFSGNSGFIRFQTPTSNQTCNGLTVVQGDGSGVSQGMLVQYDGGLWYPADADTENRSTQMLGIAISDEVADDGVLVQGIAKTNYGVLSSASAGDILYVDETAGYYTNVRPTIDNDFVRIIGYLLDISDAENPVIYFDPDKTFIKLG